MLSCVKPRSTVHQFAHLPCTIAFSVALFTISMRATPSLRQRSALQPITRTDLTVTDGSVETVNGSLLTDVPSMRAVLHIPTTPFIEVHFAYLGATEKTATLANGEVRHQFGVKLRAQDACNLVYVMWQAPPQSKLAVSMKHNPGMHSSSQCRDGGYHSLTPVRTGELPVLHMGSSHVLRADIENARLRINIDGDPVWDGSLPSEAMSFDGPVGLRSDNVRLAFRVLVVK